MKRIRDYAYFPANTMNAVELLADGELTPPMLSDRLGIHPRTARRILQGLALLGYVERGPHQRNGYTPTDQLRALGARLADDACPPRGPLTTNTPGTDP